MLDMLFTYQYALSNQQPSTGHLLLLITHFSTALDSTLLCSCIVPGRNEFAPDEDAHVVGDCVKVTSLLPFLFSSIFVAFSFRLIEYLITHIACAEGTTIITCPCFMLYCIIRSLQ